jgi:Tol biopolymer transport system component/predicted Ser/Thr protein kinase
MAADYLGRIVSHYRIESKLGEGGMGVVYRARDLELNRSAAVKFLNQTLAGEEQRRRFQQEALTASSLNHPHILTVYEAGSQDGVEYLITEFIDGSTLREWVDRERPSVRQIIEIATSIADALACAHEAGIIHRDIKPGNILVARQGYAKLVDFGLAKLLEKPGTASDDTRTMEAPPTRPGMVVGTIPYMSPEQISGKTVDARSDIFSFGAVIYEILVGQRPFLGKTDSELLLSILHSTPPPLTAIRPDTPHELRAIVEKALEKDSADRYQYAREMAVDLRRAQRAKFSAVPVMPLAVRGSPARRILPLAAVLFLAGLGAWRIYRSDLLWTNPLATARFTRVTAFESNELDGAISPDGKFAAFLSDRDGIFDGWVTQLGTAQYLNLTKGRYPDLFHEEVRSIGFSGDGSHVWLRVNARSAVPGISASTLSVPVMGGEPRMFLPKGILASTSPDGDQIVYHTADPGDPIYVATRDGNNPKLIFREKAGGHNHFPTWSPDGRWIYFVRGYPVTESDIWRIAVAGGALERLTFHVGYVRFPSALDNKTLLYTATAEDGSGPWLYGLDVGRRVSHRLSVGFERYLSISAGTGTKEYPHRLVATIGNPTGNLWQVPLTEGIADESAVSRYATPGARALSPRFGPDYLLYLSSMGGADGIWKAKGKQVVELWKGNEGAVVDSPAISPDGSRICFTFRKQGRGWLRVMSADGTDVRAVADNLRVTGAPAWSPDGKWIVTGVDGDQGRKLLKIPLDGGAPVTLADKPSFNPVLSRDGRLIVFSEMVQGAVLPMRAVTPDGQAASLPDVLVRTGGERYRSLRNGNQMIVLRGLYRQQNFWLLDLTSGKMRQLTNLQEGSAIRGFDLSPDGKSIVFDRVKENARAVVIEFR